MLETSLIFPLSFFIAVEEEGGGLFDFDGTLPLMAVTILSFMALLQATFFSPILQNIDERDTYIGKNLSESKVALSKAAELTESFEAKLVEARTKSQQKIALAQKEAQAIVSADIEQAKKDSDSLFVKLNNQLLAQKEVALSDLQDQVNAFEGQIYDRFIKVFFPTGV